MKNGLEYIRDDSDYLEIQFWDKYEQLKIGIVIMFFIFSIVGLEPLYFLITDFNNLLSIISKNGPY